MDRDLWRAVAETLLRRGYTPDYDQLLAEIADFEGRLRGLEDAVRHRLLDPVSPVQELAAQEALEGLPALLESMPKGVPSASSLARVMARRVLRMCVVLEMLDGGA